MNPFSINLHRLRSNKPGRDKAILDLLHLHQLGYAPGRPSVQLLMNLWDVSQPQVSRRMAAIRKLGVLWVEPGCGFYRLTDESAERCRRARWDAVRQRLQQEVAA